MGRNPLPRRSVVYLTSADDGAEAPAPAARSDLPRELIRATQGQPTVGHVLSGLRGGDELIVPSLDVLGGSLVEILRFTERAMRLGVRVVVLDQNLDTAAGNFGDLLLGFRVAAEFDAAAARQAWRAGIENARKAGAFRQGRPRKAELSEVAGLRAKGLGAAEIARRLNISRWSVYRSLRRLGPEAMGQG